MKYVILSDLKSILPDTRPSPGPSLWLLPPHAPVMVNPVFQETW